MSFFRDAYESPEWRRLARVYLLAAAVWIALVFFLVRISETAIRITGDIGSGELIIGNALTYRAYPGTSKKTSSVREAEPLTVLSDIIDTLNLRERVQQLQANSSGVLVQLERVYGEELRELLLTLDSRGLQIKTAEIKALPSGDVRLLSITLLLE